MDRVLMGHSRKLRKMAKPVVCVPKADGEGDVAHA